MDEKKLVRKMPPVFPTGFRIGVNDEGICIIDFADVAIEADPQIFYSVALTKKQVESLLQNLDAVMQKANNNYV